MHFFLLEFWDQITVSGIFENFCHVMKMLLSIANSQSVSKKQEKTKKCTQSVKLWLIKAIGGSWVKKWCWTYIKEFSMRSQRFLRNVNIFARSRDISVWIWPGFTHFGHFPYIFPYKKQGQKWLKSWIFWPKMPFRHGFWWFFMYLHVLDHKKLKKIIHFRYFWKYQTKIGQFLPKMGPEP